MGSARKPDEQPAHPVHVDAFWMQVHEVTWDEYRLFMFANQAGEIANKDELMDAVSRPTRPYVEMSFGMGINGFPAISMTQHAASKYAEWLSAKTGEFYRLPTEAEWEYACRAGDGDPTPLDDYAWYAANSNDKYHTVATKKPNAWGLYDMLGNVREWVDDRAAYYDYAPLPEVSVDPKGPQGGRGGGGGFGGGGRGGAKGRPPKGFDAQGRLLINGGGAEGLPLFRGGGWDNFAPYLRLSSRYYYYGTDLKVGDIGFRVVREAQ